MTPDLAGLPAVEPWEHFAGPGEEEDDALLALRTRLGDDYADSPTDEDLTAALGRAVVFLERATGRRFVSRAGSLLVDGTGSYRLFLPLPVVSVAQVAAGEGEGGGVTEVLIGDDTTPLDEELYTVQDGVGVSGRDPRDNPVIDLVKATDGVSFVSRPPTWEGIASWPKGSRNITVTATWGYCDERGLTPELARQALALLTVRELVEAGDDDGREDLRRSALLSETVQGRSWTLSPTAVSGGLTGDRALDLLIRSLRAPPVPRVPRPPRRASRVSRTRLLF